MLDLTAASLREEIQFAESARKDKLACWKDMIGQYTGPAWSAKNKSVEAPVNHAYEYASINIPKIIHRNPRVSVTSRKTGPPEEVATALQHGINRWIQDTDLRDKLVQIAFDMTFAYGVAMVCQAPQQPGGQDWSVPHWPTVHRISPDRFLFDPLALTFEEKRWAAHLWVRDKADLLLEAQNDPEGGWDIAAIDSIGPDGALDKLPERKQSASGSPPARKEILAYDIWVPEAMIEGFTPEQGYHGAIFTVSAENDVFLRAPRPYYGPRWGPYVLFGVYIVPGSAFPLSPLQATYGQTQTANAQANAMTKSMENYKRFVAVDTSAKSLAKALKDGKHDYIYALPGLEKSKMDSVEVGGFTQQMARHFEYAQARLDQVSGIHDPQRGEVSDETATAVAVADSSTSVRIGFIKDQFTKAVNELDTTAGWFLYHDDRTVFPLGPEGAQMLGMGDPWYFGGAFDANSGYTYDDLELSVDAYSMERTDESVLQRNALKMLEIVIMEAPIIPNTPWIDWNTINKGIGDAMNFPGFADAINVAMAQMVMGMPVDPMAGQIGTPQLGAQPASAPPQPGYGGKAGMNGVQKPAMQQAASMGTTNGQARRY